MGEYTKNLQLYKADTLEDGNDTFNINRMLNDNWDKIDEMLKKLPVQNGGLYINSETTEEDKAKASDALRALHRNIETFYTLAQIGLTIGSETMAGIANALPNNSILIIPVSAASYNASEYPIVDNGYLFVKKMNVNRVFFQFEGQITGRIFTGTYYSSWGGWKEVFLADGSVPMSGNLKYFGGLGLLMGFDGGTGLRHYDEAGSTANARTLQISTSKLKTLAEALRLVDRINGSEKGYNIFGEHNKPSGSYTGNGSSTTRTINIGGVGNILYISSPYGFGFVTADGGFFVQASYDTTAYVVSYSSSYIKFVDGVLTIESSSSYINSSSYTYTYRVL